PSFLRTLLTCISMLRSKGENLRLSTKVARRSRVTTRPASRSSASSRLNSTEVNSTGLPAWRTMRVAGSSSIPPTRTTSGTGAVEASLTVMLRLRFKALGGEILSNQAAEFHIIVDDQDAIHYLFFTATG